MSDVPVETNIPNGKDAMRVTKNQEPRAEGYGEGREWFGGGEPSIGSNAPTLEYLTYLVLRGSGGGGITSEGGSSRQSTVAGSDSIGLFPFR